MCNWRRGLRHFFYNQEIVPKFKEINISFWHTLKLKKSFEKKALKHCLIHLMAFIGRKKYRISYKQEKKLTMNLGPSRLSNGVPLKMETKSECKTYKYIVPA